LGTLEHALGFGIGENDAACPVYLKDGVGGGFQEQK
jgi:hypothetical protein